MTRRNSVLARAVEKVLNGRYVPMRKHLPVEAAIVRNKADIVAFADIRTRSAPSGFYTHLMIPLTHFNKLRQLAALTGKPVYLFIEFIDGLFYVHVAKAEFFPKLMHEDGAEPMAAILISNLTKVPEA